MLDFLFGISYNIFNELKNYSRKCKKLRVLMENYDNNDKMTENTDFDPFTETYDEPLPTTAEPAPENTAVPTRLPFGATSPYAYGAPYRYYPTGMATASMIIGICSVVLFPLLAVFLPLLIAPVIGIVLGIVYKTKHYPLGKTASTAGIILSALSIVLCIALTVYILTNYQEIFQTLKDTDPEMYEQQIEPYREYFEEYGFVIPIRGIK
jgi:hypothetical protein